MNLFSEHNPDVITAKQLAEAMTSGQKTIQLPAFQRDAVWDENHIQLLWDSILRGYPISSIIFAKADPSTVVKPLSLQKNQAQQTNQSPETEYILLDGQQRSRAIALGIRPWQTGDSARMWIDLGQLESNLSRFFVCTLRKPWGVGATDAMQRKALEKMNDGEDLRIDQDTLIHTWPVKASLPVPLAELIQLLLNSEKEKWRSLVPPYDITNEATENIEDLLSQIEKALSYCVPIYLVENLLLDTDILGEIFKRLNRQGVQMSEEDLFFSALKVIWPQAHDLVWQIFSDPGTGRFLGPASIVHLATRLVEVKKARDIAKLDQKTFKRLSQPSAEGEESFLGQMQILLTPGATASNRSQIHEALRCARQTLMYNPLLSKDDPGLPAPFLANLRARVWHTLTAWIIKNGTHITPENRLEMIRYSLFEYFYINPSKSSTGLLHIPFKLAYESNSGFPGKQIYTDLLESKLVDKEIYSLSAFRENILAKEPQYHLLHSEQNLTMWAQRQYVQDWFPYFDPTIHAGQDLPYDVDHIVPRAHMNMQGKGKNHKLPQIFWDWRDALMDSPGNYRIWPKSINRSDGQSGLEEKFILNIYGNQIPDKSYFRRYGLTSSQEVQIASFILDTQLDNWRIISRPTDYHNWTEPRVRAFRNVVDLRRIEMYESLFQALKWEYWLE